MNEIWQKQLVTGKVLLGLLFASWLWFFIASVSEYVSLSQSLEDQKNEYNRLGKQIELASGGAKVDEFLADKAALLASWYGQRRYVYPPSEILNHLAILGENTYLVEVAPRIKSTRRKKNITETTVYVQLKGKYHQMARFVNLLESPTMAYPVRVKKLVIKRTPKNPSGDLDARLEVIFLSLSEDLAPLVAAKTGNNPSNDFEADLPPGQEENQP